MAVKELGQAATESGWRQRATDFTAPRVGNSRLPFTEDQARAGLGLLFLGLSVKYLVGTLQRFRAR